MSDRVSLGMSDPADTTGGRADTESDLDTDEVSEAPATKDPGTTIAAVKAATSVTRLVRADIHPPSSDRRARESCT